jgi:hypothetical protein
MTASNDQSGISTSNWRRPAGWALIAGSILAPAESRTGARRGPYPGHAFRDPVCLELMGT